MGGAFIVSLVFAALSALILKEHGRQHQLFLHGFHFLLPPMYTNLRLRLLTFLFVLFFAAAAVWFMPSWLGRIAIVIGIFVWNIRGFRAADTEIRNILRENHLREGMSEEEATMKANEWLCNSCLKIPTASVAVFSPRQARGRPWLNFPSWLSSRHSAFVAPQCSDAEGELPAAGALVADAAFLVATSDFEDDGEE